MGAIIYDHAQLMLTLISIQIDFSKNLTNFQLATTKVMMQIVLCHAKENSSKPFSYSKVVKLAEITVFICQT